MPESQPESAGATLVTEPGVTGLPLEAETVPLGGVVAGAPSVKRRRLTIGTGLAIVWLVAVVFGALFAKFLPIPGPNEQFTEIARKAPFATITKPNGGTTTPFAEGHLLGGGRNGQDLLSQAVYGARNSLIVGFGAIAFGLVVGGLLGLVAGYYRGKVDTMFVAMFDVMLSIPPLVLALALVAVFRGRFADLLILVLALGIVSIPVLGRITRANALVWSQREFVTAARAQGAKNGRIMIREVLPNVLPAMFSIALLGVAIVIVFETALRLLGVGLSTTDPSWGNIIQDGASFLTSGETPHMVFVGSAFIFFTVLSLNYLGDVVRERFDVREAAI